MPTRFCAKLYLTEGGILAIPAEAESASAYGTARKCC